MEICLKVDKQFKEICENAGTRPEVVLKCFMWDVMIAGEGAAPGSWAQRDGAVAGVRLGLLPAAELP